MSVLARRIDETRHAALTVPVLPCPIRFWVNGRAAGDTARAVSYDVADELRAGGQLTVEVEVLRPSAASIEMFVLISPRVFIRLISTRPAADGRMEITMTVANTLENTADLHIQVIGATGTAGVSDNLPPASTRDYVVALPAAPGQSALEVSVEKSPEALEGGYKYTDMVRLRNLSPP